MARILIVDDEPLNRELLHGCLEGSGHELIDAASGEAALDAIEAAGVPDLVLLDVMMPGIDGFATARRIKELTREQFVPIILVTALHDRTARLEGLHAGADEFLTKPVDLNELNIRITHLLALRDNETALVRRNVELAELQRFSAEMSQLLVHDLKNPLTVILSNLDYLLEDPDIKLDTREALTDSKEAGRRALRLLANLLDLTRLESGRFQPHRTRIALADVVAPLLRQRMLLAKSRGIAMHSDFDAATTINADVELMARVFENIFDNALRYTPPGGRVAFAAHPASGGVELRIGNTGSPIPTDARTRIFEKFGQAGGGIGRMNLGLGLYFCRLATEAHGGRIWVEETRELPTVFGLALPS
jgi:signal transduction histidine kinase